MTHRSIQEQDESEAVVFPLHQPMFKSVGTSSTFQVTLPYYTTESRPDWSNLENDLESEEVAVVSFNPGMLELTPTGLLLLVLSCCG